MAKCLREATRILICEDSISSDCGWFARENTNSYRLDTGCEVVLFGRVDSGSCSKLPRLVRPFKYNHDYGLKEDDQHNPACVGDNVSDMASTGADLFGSFAEATCATVALVASPGSWENLGIVTPVLRTVSTEYMTSVVRSGSMKEFSPSALCS